MTEYGYASPVIRLPKSKVDSYSTPVVNGPVVSETLYLSSVPSSIGEADLHRLLQQYNPIEIQLYRHSGEGYLRFRDASVADQVYALYQGFQFDNGAKLHFGVYQNNQQHEAEGMLLKVTRLPQYVNNSTVYNLFRRYGPLALCKLVLEQDESVFLGTALVQYFYHEDSETAIQEMHGQRVHGNKIVVEPFVSNDHYQESVKCPFLVYLYHVDPNNALIIISSFLLLISQSDSFPLSMNPSDKPSDPNYVDVMNLYIKNLDPKVNNNDLFDAFRAFGRIVSARVMTNPANNQSKGYGFVSYSRSDEARLALGQMNGKIFFQKPLMVSFHAPKKPRQAPPPAPSPQEYSPPYHDSKQQHQHQHDRLSPPNSSVISSTINGLGIDNVDQIAMDIKDLSIGQHYPSIAPYPIQRKSSVADSYMTMQQVRMSPPFSSSPISGSTGHSLASLASGLSIQQPPAHQHHQHQHHYNSTPTLTPVGGLSHSSSPSAPSNDLKHRFDTYNNGYKQTSDGRPSLRRKSSLESISTVMTESSANLQRQRLTHAVLNCKLPFDNQKMVTNIVDMLSTLKKKERSLCLFNQGFLKEKIELALEALETFNDGDDSDSDDEEEKELQKMLPRQPAKKSPPVKSTPIGAPLSVDDSQSSFQHNRPVDIPKSVPARVSKAIPIVAPPVPITTASANTDKKINGSNTKTAKGLTEDNKAIIDSLMKSMEGKHSHEKKQLLGDRLFPLVKATGTKQAPKVTIALLDSVDLLELATMMFDKDALKKQVEITFTTIKQ